jgi:electron transport complex protein RnfG
VRDKIKHFLKESWLLIVASFFFGLLIAVTNAALEERIDYNLNVYLYNKSAKMVLPEAANFDMAVENIIVKSKSGKEMKTSVKKAVDTEGNIIGWVFVCIGNGYGGEMQIIIAVDPDFQKIIGYAVLSSNETPSIGGVIQTPKFKKQFEGAPAGEFNLVKSGDWGNSDDNEIVAQSGATISSKALVDAFNMFIPQVKEKMQAEGLIK